MRPRCGNRSPAPAILNRRGDVIIGPGNGVLLPTVEVLGGAVEVRQISNPAVMRHPVSAVFHGRDVFCSAAAHLANGLRFARVGEPVDPATLAPPPFTDAIHDDGRWLARVIHVDKFGNAQLNISQDQWRSLAPPAGGMVEVVLSGGRRLAIAHHATFGDVRPGAPVLPAEDDGRLALAVNRGNFAATHQVELGDEVVVEPTGPSRRSSRP